MRDKLSLQAVEAGRTATGPGNGRSRDDETAAQPRRPRAGGALTGVDAVTLSRYVRKVAALLGALPLRMRQPQGFLLVDTTSVRVGSTDRRSFSGHKHQRCAKVQVIADETGFVQHSGAVWLGSVHDKTVYDKERVTLGEALGTLILAHLS